MFKIAHLALLGMLTYIMNASPALAKELRILCLGDSLTEGYMLSPDEAWPALVEKDLKAKGYSVKLINAGTSGSTAASGPARLKWHLRDKQRPDIMILALGANDGLRGLDLASTKKNLSTTIKEAKAAGIAVLLAGMRIPPNYGDTYTEAFQKLFVELASEEKIPLIPFLLAGVGGEPSLNLADGIHPNSQGYKIIAKTVIEHLEPMLRERRP